MQAKASLKHARISPRKVRMVLDMVRGQHVALALDQLRFTRKAAAPMVAKLIDSAIANAQRQKENLDLGRLYVKLAWADKAPDSHMLRWRPRAQGRATPIQKGMSHITVVLEERAEG
jgi:large subunit ribosomal protein L22